MSANGMPRSDQLPTTISQPNIGDAYTEQASSSHVCYICQTSFADNDSVLVHLHHAHGHIFSLDCGCSWCKDWFEIVEPPADAPQTVQQRAARNAFAQDFATYTASNQQSSNGVGSAQVVQAQPARTAPTTLPQQLRLDHTEHDASLSESNLPAYMGKLEPGRFNSATRGWSHTTRAKNGFMRDQAGNLVISPSSGNMLKDITFLPATIPENVEAWRLNFWMRKAAETGVYLSYDDIADRMPVVVPKAGVVKASASTNGNTLSMRVQRYIEGIGQLSIVEKKKTGLPALQSMETIEQLYVIQGRLNTCWLPNNMTDHGPWIVVQPKVHPGYDSQHAHNYRGNSYVIEQAYGLSDRVKRTFDGMVYLNMAAAKAGLVMNAAGRKQVKGKKPAKERDAEFEIWCRGGDGSLPTLQQIHQALDNAPIENEVLEISGSEANATMALPTPTAISLMQAAPTWSRLTFGEVARLMATAKLNSKREEWIEWADVLSVGDEDPPPRLPTPPVTSGSPARPPQDVLGLGQGLEDVVYPGDDLFKQALRTELGYSEQD
ncbi:hypothetical protein LTR85_000663 [Meristemomyces frigidus]|nr:hypothetical protein LTR85_000663 [Meristemomyces frigidus]